MLRNFVIMRSLFKCVIFICSSVSLAQTPYEITINTQEAYQENLFFFKGGEHPRSVMILSPEGEELFVESWGMKGWDFKVNENNHLTYYDRDSDGWFVMDSLQQEVDSVYCLNGYTADNHDFIALPNGNYILFAYDPQPYAMDTVVEGGDPNALIEGVIIQELDADHNLLFEWSSWDHFHITEIMNGMLAGLAGITPASGFVEIWASAIIGLIVGIVSYYFCRFINRIKFNHI